jgi:hypothetical protein
MGMAVAVIILIGLLPIGMAQAQTDECEETWRRLVVWSEEEASRGLSTSGLESLHALLPRVEACTGATGAGMGAGVDRWRGLAGIYFDDRDVDRVICLMERESGGNPGARNPSSGAAGLMQVMPGWAGVFGYLEQDLFDPTVNLWIASQIRDQQGWGAWSPYLRGACH